METKELPQNLATHNCIQRAGSMRHLAPNTSQEFGQQSPNPSSYIEMHELGTVQ